jgi:rare lipoprotein A
MNKHRWTCLTTLVLTTVVAPITNVHAKNLSSPVVLSGRDYSSLSPQSLPTITPLVVTELETEAAIPAVIKPVPQVSKLPIVVPLFGQSKTLAKQFKNPKISSLPKGNRHTQSSVVKLPSTTPIFNPKSQATDPILAISHPIDSSVAPVNSVVELQTRITTQTPRTPAFRSFASTTASAPILVVRSDKTRSSQRETVPAKVITNFTTAQAEIETLSENTDARFGKVASTPTVPEIVPVPQVAPMVAPTSGGVIDRDEKSLRQQTDLPSFEAGLPVFIFDNEQPPQIVATAIAQVGESIVAPEPSIAIPVDRPKQSTIPTQLPVRVVPTVPALQQPLTTELVKIEQPSTTVQPVLDKIVATQTGKASWYGSEAGSRTANGERYNPNGLTAAHRTLAFGTKVRITSLKTGKSTIVRINDRGPFHRRRMIDVSAGAAKVIGIKNDGIGDVRMEVLGSEG